MAKISYTDIIKKTKASEFGQAEFNKEKIKGKEAKEKIARMAWGGKTLARINMELKKAGVIENARKRYLKTIDGKKKDEFLTQKQVKERNLANNKDTQTQKQGQRDVSILRRNVLGERVKGSIADLGLGLSRANAVISATQMFDKKSAAKNFSSLSKPTGVKPIIKLVV